MKIFTYIVNVFLLFCFIYGVWLFILKKSNRLHWGKILTNFDEIGSLNLDKLSMCTCVHSFALKLIWSTIWTNLSCFPSMVLSVKLGSSYSHVLFEKTMKCTQTKPPPENIIKKAQILVANKHRLPPKKIEGERAVAHSLCWSIFMYCQCPEKATNT